MFSCILFDLDGTISDPKQGICGCVQYALRSFGIEEPELDRLEPFIGPPLAESFMKYYNFTAEQAQEAVEKYRERFSVTGKYENVLYPGMGALLHDLKASGATLAIASSKPTVYVEDILVHFGIREYFDIVVGSELDGRRVHKEEVVAEVLSQLAARGESDPDKMVMIGDRSFDVEGAKAIGAHCIAVSYGYAQPGELENAGAEIIEYDDAVRITRFKPLTRCNVKTMPHPGFPTDMQPQMAVLLSVAEGTSILTEGVWDNRFQYVGELSRMGANIQVDGKVAVIEGVPALTGVTVKATDLRAGAAMIIAGMVARGETRVTNIQYVDRGYEDVVEKFSALGADIRRVPCDDGDDGAATANAG